MFAVAPSSLVVMIGGLGEPLPAFASWSESRYDGERLDVGAQCEADMVGSRFCLERQYRLK